MNGPFVSNDVMRAGWHAAIVMAGLGAMLLVFIGAWTSRGNRWSKGSAAVRTANLTKLQRAWSRERSPARRPKTAWRAAPVAVLIHDRDGGGSPVSAWVVDRSPLGLSLEVGPTAEISAEATLHVRPCEASVNIPWVALKIVRTREAGEGLELEGRYVHPPVWAVRMLFG